MTCSPTRCVVPEHLPPVLSETQRRKSFPSIEVAHKSESRSSQTFRDSGADSRNRSRSALPPTRQLNAVELVTVGLLLGAR